LVPYVAAPRPEAAPVRYHPNKEPEPKHEAHSMKQGTAIIIGAGPAGLTAAIELQRQSGIKPILIEASHEIGGISRTVRYKGNRMDIGGHRFFSKSDRVMRCGLI
jgi:monoamine oxidase